MNGSQWIPEWAQKAQDAPHQPIELELLRHFFDSWKALHAIPNKRETRKESEAAAQILVDAAHAVEALRG